MEVPQEKLFHGKWRAKAASHLSGSVREVRVGTGKNMRCYPKNARAIAVDISEKMLAKAMRRAKKAGSGRQVCSHGRTEAGFQRRRLRQYLVHLRVSLSSGPRQGRLRIGAGMQGGRQDGILGPCEEQQQTSGCYHGYGKSGDPLANRRQSQPGHTGKHREGRSQADPRKGPLYQSV